MEILYEIPELKGKCLTLQLDLHRTALGLKQILRALKLQCFVYEQPKISDERIRQIVQKCKHKQNLSAK